MLEAVAHDLAQAPDTRTATVGTERLDQVAPADEPAEDRFVHGTLERALVQDAGEVEEGARGAGDGESALAAQIAGGELRDLVKADSRLRPAVHRARHFDHAPLLRTASPPGSGRCASERRARAACEYARPLPRPLWGGPMAEQENGSIKGVKPAGLSAIPDGVGRELAGQQLPVVDHAALASRHPRAAGSPGPTTPTACEAMPTGSLCPCQRALHRWHANGAKGAVHSHLRGPSNLACAQRARRTSAAQDQRRQSHPPFTEP